jgi:hypothetical protein
MEIYDFNSPAGELCKVRQSIAEVIGDRWRRDILCSMWRLAIALTVTALVSGTDRPTSMKDLTFLTRAGCVNTLIWCSALTMR